MALRLFTSDLIGSGVQITANTDDLIIVAEDVIVSSSNTNTINSDGTANSVNVVIAGDLYAYGNGVYLGTDGTTGQHNVTVQATGSIVAYDFTGIIIHGDDSIAVNYGQITTHRSVGMVLSEAEFGTLINYGTINANDTGIFSNGFLLLDDVVNAHLENHGSMNSNSTTAAAISVEASGAVYTLNTGLVGGRFAAYRSINSATDTVDNSGVFQGNVLLGAGDDAYTAFDGGIVLGVIDGGLGNDTLTGGSNADFMDGGDDNDRLFGRGGDDDLRGGLGSDFMSGGMGDDQIIGDDGSDKMFGGSGDDTLNGGRDKDTIHGGDGNDEIKGGRLNDVLNGGAGADVFVYGVKQDSSTGASDVIQDYEVGIDKIDLSAVASGLTFVGTAAFSGTGNEVRYDIAGNGRTYIQVDTDANGSADMRIWLTDVGALGAVDFVL
ncbi:Hemolysin-type calcium-binding repeat-containing protein [Pseudosulfitobacter pseudonitzschiae]|nr:M10 family metallopeptidase C-terminal domain-containing protein [Pseudosulfitobacter pseudonitzschiae]QKS08450.1 M10 family metallopeptidase C-terminal domain-containing protein [Pseudosulfitobacter pseudonitzschiae]SHF74603.1 Hemolysin-type calcium-binding repeat-containing protein [Pseudosulfitobacter pseudonitzschiae]